MEFMMDKYKQLWIYWKYMLVDKPYILIWTSSNILEPHKKCIDLMRQIYKVLLKGINIFSGKNHIRMFMDKKGRLFFVNPKN